ncbi:MAG: hypothetical protein LBH29_01545 [Elusimicrobiota bacterium]|nr:hypothetical protein [Elusimicrobiota bacterium]
MSFRRAQTHSADGIPVCYKTFTFLPFAFEQRKEMAKWIPAKNEALLRFIFASMTMRDLAQKQSSLSPIISP